MIEHIRELHREVWNELEDKKISKREFGILVWKRWRTFNLHGHLKIGRLIQKMYGVLQEDIDAIRYQGKKYNMKIYMRKYRSLKGEELKEYYKKYYAEHKEEIDAYHKTPEIKEKRRLRGKDMRRVYTIYLQKKKEKLDSDEKIIYDIMIKGGI